MKYRTKNYTLRQEPGVYYVWVGGSCDYNRKERFGGGASVIEQEQKIIERYTVTDIHTTEYRMLLAVIIHALETLPEKSVIQILTNVAYLQNFDQPLQPQSANPDLIAQCIQLKERHEQVALKVVPYHKYDRLVELHQIAHEEMNRLRISYTQ